jgi:hypothetical protein
MRGDCRIYVVPWPSKLCSVGVKCNATNRGGETAGCIVMQFDMTTCLVSLLTLPPSLPPLLTGLLAAGCRVDRGKAAKAGGREGGREGRLVH